MVTVDKYIRNLLFEHDCVIIPEFGGLLTHHVGAHYDATNCVFIPARKRLAFNEILKIDDGLLTYYVAAHEKLSREEAILVVKRYVDSLRQELLAGGTVQFESIGSFEMNTEGKLVFEPDYSQNYNNEWFGLQSLAVREVVRKESSYEDSDVNVLESEMEFVSSFEPITRRLNWLNWAAAAVFVGVVTLLGTLNSTSESPSLLSTLNPFETVRDFTFESYTPASHPAIAEVTPAPKPASVVVTPAPVVKAAPVEKVAYIPKHEVLEAENVKKSQLKITKENVNTSKAPPVVATKSIQKVKSTNRYFLIAGSFGRIKNAADLKGQLINKGFTESSILESSAGNLIKVSAGSYASMESALMHKKKVDAVTGDESWVYHRK